MAFERGGIATLLLNNPTPATYTFTATLTNISLSLDAGLVEVTVLSDQNRDYQQTIKTGQISVTGFFENNPISATVSSQDFFLHDALENGKLLNWRIGFNSGSTKFYRNNGYSSSTANGCHIISYELSNEVNGVMGFSATLGLHGTWERV